MMLSICIPIYNFDVNRLIKSLSKEIIGNNLKAEIVLIDDASDEKFKTINEEECNKFKYIQLKKKHR